MISLESSHNVESWQNESFGFILINLKTLLSAAIREEGQLPIKCVPGVWY